MMRAESLNFYSTFRTARHISQIQIPVTIIEVSDLPFRIQIIKIADRRKPNGPEKLNCSMPQSYEEALIFGNSSPYQYLIVTIPHIVAQIYPSVSISLSIEHIRILLNKEKTAPIQVHPEYSLG
ncbi:hypothetical protein J2T20_000016 [Paenibacillus wynnii]|nr:hypothetical protein [Paenibacillus wynnii]